MKVLKFGGSSVADAEQIKKVAKIIQSQSDVKSVIVSAPGKRSDDDIKVTDQLISYSQTKDEATFELIQNRFLDIIKNLDSQFDILSFLDIIRSDILDGASQSYILSRGEYLNALIIADYLGASFVDAKDIIKIGYDNKVDARSYELTSKALKDIDFSVIPGFYGMDMDGKIQTFSRGGSDISGAIVAKAVGADIYQNWTDVSGMLQADPRIVAEAKTIKELTYREVKELAVMGASVFHEDAIAPAYEGNIPINIRNTNQPADDGTLISITRDASHSPIAAVSGLKPFLWIIVTKTGSCEQIKQKLDAASIRIYKQSISENAAQLWLSLAEGMEPEEAEAIFEQTVGSNGYIVKGMVAHIAVVGQDILNHVDIFIDMLNLLQKNNIQIHYANYGGSTLRASVMVDAQDYAKALQIMAAAI
ncbi:MAG: aspartate kinase [Alphaproteobacteria bacterium]